MINGKIQNYIDNHSFCSEFIFNDWEFFLDYLYSEGGSISGILWWDHCKKSQVHESVGSGGYNDPEDNEFVYAETQLYEGGLETKTLDEIKEYIHRIIKEGFQYDGKYISHDLVPSFYLVKG